MRVLPVLLLVLATGCATSEPPTPPRTWSAELSTAPTLLTLTDDDVYGASFGNGVGGSQVYRVDRSSGERVAQRTIAGEPNAMALGPGGELWVATVRLPDQVAGTGLQVLDPQTLQTRRALDVPGTPLSLAFAERALWVGDADGVRRLDPSSGEVLQSVPTAHRASRLVPVPGGLLVLGPSAVQRIEADGRAGAVRELPAYGSVTATAQDALVWVVHPDAEDRSVLVRLDPVTLATVATAASPGRAGAVAELEGDRLWVAEPRGGRLLCADPRTGEVLAERRLALTGPLVADPAGVVVAQAGSVAGLPAECD